MRAKAEVKLLKTENEDLLSRIEAEKVELHMLRHAVEEFKLVEEDANHRC